MALGLGYTVANSRRDRVDVINQQADGHTVPAPDSADRDRELLPVRPSRLVIGKRSRIDGRALLMCCLSARSRHQMMTVSVCSCAVCSYPWKGNSSSGEDPGGG
jgi:hypothetical protein